MGIRDQFPHTLVPLDLAVLIVQQEIYGNDARAYGADPNAIANYIAATVPIFQVGNAATTEPRILFNIHHEAVFKDGGKELVFLDGRPSQHLLAIQASEVPCVIAMLKEPQRAQTIRREAVEEKSRQLVKQSHDLKAHHAELVEEFNAQKRRAEQLSLAYKDRLTAGHPGRCAR